MNTDPVTVALWIGALVCATNPAYNPFPPDLQAIAERYYRTFPPRARA